MKLEIKLFATLKERAGKATITLDIDEPVDGSKMFDELFRQYPALKPFEKSMLLSVNREFADSARPIHNGDEIALFPPVSGG